ncbi:hypothetical protein D3C72_1740290 [compost metagenome]
MGQLALQRGDQIGQQQSRRQGKELAPQPPRDDIDDQIQQTIGHQQPHGGEMPLQGAAEPAAQSQGARQFEREEWRRVIDAPAAGGQHDDGHGIEPVRDAQPGWMDHACLSVHHIAPFAQDAVLTACRMALLSLRCTKATTCSCSGRQLAGSLT